MQGLRGLAVIAVILYHFEALLPGGFVGVDMFFVISGFVISASLYREFASSQGIRLRRFYLRRFWRLFPALSLVVSVTLVLSAFIVSPLGPQQNSAITGLFALLGLGNVGVAISSGGYFQPAADTNSLLHVWSLGVEEQFYLVFPIFMLGVFILASSKKPRLLSNINPSALSVLTATTSLAMAISFTSSLQGWDYPTFLVWGFYSPITRGWEFLFGALVYFFSLKSRGFSQRANLFLMLGGFALLIASVVSLDSSSPFPIPWAFVPVVGTAMIILSGSSRNVMTRRQSLLESGFLVRTGQLSYSLYLWHWPLLVFAQYLAPGNLFISALALSLAILLAHFSFTYLEEPLRNNPSTRTKVRALSLTLTPVLIGFSLLFANVQSYGNPEITHMKTEISRAYLATDMGCSQTISLQEIDPDCFNLGYLGADAPRERIYLLGDSNAEQFSNGLALAAQTLKHELAVATGSSCPFIADPVRVVNELASDKRCEEYVLESFDFLSEQEPGIVIIANSGKYPHEDAYAIGELRATDDHSRINAWQTAQVQTANELMRSGHKVVFIEEIPKWYELEKPGLDTFWDPSLCSFSQALDGCIGRQPLDDHISRIEPTTIQAFSNKLGRVQVWSLQHVLCTQGVCETATGSLQRYKDSGHLSAQQSEQLKDFFREKLESEW